MSGVSRNGSVGLGERMAPGDGSRSPLEKAKLPRYAAILALYPLGYVGFTALRRRLGKELPQFGPYDLLLMGGAAHRLSRIVTKERVTEPLRAPVTHRREPDGSVSDEAPRGGGTRRVLGELLTCPYCMSSWMATSLAYGMTLAPRHTRFIASIFAADALSDMLHCVFNRLKP